LVQVRAALGHRNFLLHRLLAQPKALLPHPPRCFRVLQVDLGDIHPCELLFALLLGLGGIGEAAIPPSLHAVLLLLVQVLELRSKLVELVDLGQNEALLALLALLTRNGVDEADEVVGLNGGFGTGDRTLTPLSKVLLIWIDLSTPVDSHPVALENLLLACFSLHLEVNIVLVEVLLSRHVNLVGQSVVALIFPFTLLVTLFNLRSLGLRV